MRKSLRKISAAIAGCALAMALTVGAVPNAANAAVKPQCTKDGEKAGKAKFNPDGTYHAYFGLQQQNTWIFRDQWFSPTLGVKGTDLAGNDYASILQSKDGKVLKMDGTVTDAEITGNGTYTIGVTGLNSCIDTDLDANPISMIYASTDIPISAIKDGTVKISDVKMSIDGKEAFSGEPYTNEDTELVKLYQFDCTNTYKKDQFENPSILCPSDSIQITFTISGFTNDNPNAVAATPTPAADSSASSSTSSTSSTESNGGTNTTAVAVVAVVAVVVVAGVIVFVKKKKN